MNTEKDQQLREQLIKHLQGGQAFLPVEKMLNEITFDQLGIIPEGIPYSFYQQFYHMRIAQYDILEFSRNPEYESPDWPDDYWPEQPAPTDEQAWKQLVDAYFEERQQLCDLIANPDHDFFAPIPHGSGQTLLREAILVVEHSAYHSGQLLLILRLLGLHQ